MGVDNLLDTHPPFQIDGNFGATAGMAEALVQSHGGEVHLLPALPAAWPQGRVHGLRLRGGFELDLRWRGGAWLEAVVDSRTGGPCTVRLTGGARVSCSDGTHGRGTNLVSFAVPRGGWCRLEAE